MGDLLPVPERFKCNNCGALDVNGGIGGWSVHTELWQEHGNGKGILCIHCFELRLGRRIQKSDLATLYGGYYEDNKTNSYIQLIFKE
jgi:hypothetical protein